MSEREKMEIGKGRMRNIISRNKWILPFILYCYSPGQFEIHMNFKIDHLMHYSKSANHRSIRDLPVQHPSLLGFMK